MARIPGVPTLEPVAQPLTSPGQAAKVGEAVAGMGDVGQDNAMMEWKIRAAQEHVDGLAARNQLDGAYADIMDKLKATVNSGDVPGVIEEGKANFRDIAAEWSKSSASVAIQQDAESLLPSLNEVGTAKHIDLMGKENRIVTERQSDVFAAIYAKDRAMGGSGAVAAAGFAKVVQDGVDANLTGTVEAADINRQFLQKSQILQIQNAITNANPDVNNAVYEDIDHHPEAFPEVTREQLDVLKGQAMEAFHHHVLFQQWGERELAMKNVFPSQIQQFTNQATGDYDEAGNLAFNANLVAQGKMTENVADSLAQGISAHATQLAVQDRENAQKINNDVVHLFDNNHYGEAHTLLEKHRLDRGFGKDYESLIKYGDSRRRELRVIGVQERSIARQEASENSLESVAELGALPGVLTSNDIPQLMHDNPKLKYSDAQHVVAMRSAEHDPYFKSSMEIIENSANSGFLTLADVGKARIALIKATSPTAGRPNGISGQDLITFTQNLVKPANEKAIGGMLDKLMSIPTTPATRMPSRQAPQTSRRQYFRDLKAANPSATDADINGYLDKKGIQ